MKNIYYLKLKQNSTLQFPSVTNKKEQTPVSHTQKERREIIRLDVYAPLSYHLASSTILHLFSSCLQQMPLLLLIKRSEKSRDLHSHCRLFSERRKFLILSRCCQTDRFRSCQADFLPVYFHPPASPRFLVPDFPATFLQQ